MVRSKAARWALLVPLFALLYLALPSIYQYLGIGAVQPVVNTSPAELVIAARPPVTSQAARVHSLPLDGSLCRAPEHKPAPRTTSEIYKWVDANGRTHFGDRSLVKTAKRVEVNRAAASQFGLTVRERGSAMPLDFREQLEISIRKSYLIMAQLLPQESIRASNVNLWVFGSSSGYESFKKKYAPGLSGASTGFHSPKENIAAVWHKNDNQLMRTSIHEAAHVNNWAMLGRTPNWLNEGLAEYLENMKVYGQVVEIVPSAGWLRTLDKRSLRLSAVLGATREDWGGEKRQALYAHSWAFVYFLLSEKDTLGLLKGFLDVTAAQPCVLNDFISYSRDNFEGGFRQLSGRFYSWQPEKAASHVY